VQFSDNFLKWLSLCGNKSSIPSDFILDQSDFSYFPPDFGIQQNEQEILEFIQVLKDNNCRNILEVGLGYYGSTHVLFREHFKSVVTIELSLERVKSFFIEQKIFLVKIILVVASQNY